MQYETPFECEHSPNKIVIPLNPQWKTIGIQLSGGMDSALLAYLTARTIQEKGLGIRIKPISFDIDSKPPILPSARAVLKRLTELTGTHVWAEPYEFAIPLTESQPPNKMYATRNHIKALFTLKLIDVEFRGTTRNPPPEVRQRFTHDEYREAGRDTPATIYIAPNTIAPLAFCDKRGVRELYSKFHLDENLLPLTVSCDADKHQLVNDVFPCGTCWWCEERAWALSSN